MKIVFITAATFTIPWFRADMLRCFAQAGCDVLVLGNEPEDKWSSYFDELGARYEAYPVSRNGINPFKDVGTIRALIKTLADEQPDKVLTNFAKANIYGCMAAHKAGIGDVYTIMGGLGTVFHGTGLKSLFIRGIVSAQYRHALKYNKAVFFQNKDDAALLARIGAVTPEQTVFTAGSGVNLGQFAQTPIPEKASFLFVGRLVRGKGILDYLEAARIVKTRHPEVEFHVVGPFDSNPTAITPTDLQGYTEDGTARYHGEQSDVRPFLDACTCFVLPSYYGEGTPKSALEAMATGRPLIVADAVGCREVVREGVNGFLVPPKNPKAIAAAMTRLIEEPGLKERMGAESRRMAEDVFDVRKVNDVICKAMEIENA